MKSTFAIGIPDKVGRAERDRNSAIAKLHDSVVKRKTNVIEFDLPKGYTAEDAYWTGLCWILDREFLGSIPEKANYITRKEMIDHFGLDFFLSSQELANFYLLLAAANGHKLE